MVHVGIGWKALGVPLIAGAMWLLPSDRPDTEVAGAVESAVLADAAPTTAGLAPSTTQTSEVATSVPEADVEPTAPLIVTTTLPPTTVTQTTTRAVATTTTTTPPTTQAVLRKGEEALARVSYDWRSAFPEWRIEFRGPRNGLRALTYPEERRIEIFVRESDTASSLHRVFAHELGHVVDVELNSDQDRRRWIEQRGISGDAPWWPSAEAPDFATGAGDFAEAFAVWETGVTTRSSVAGQPSAADLELMRELSRS